MEFLARLIKARPHLIYCMVFLGQNKEDVFLDLKTNLYPFVFGMMYWAILALAEASMNIIEKTRSLPSPLVKWELRMILEGG